MILLKWLHLLGNPIQWVGFGPHTKLIHGIHKKGKCEKPFNVVLPSCF